MTKSLSAAEISVSRDTEKKITPANDHDYGWDYDDDDSKDSETWHDHW